jgi:ABC-type multidrug transport system fused ATPase/permease subunit
MTTASPKITFKEYSFFLKRYLQPRLLLVIGLGVTLLVNIGLQIVNPLIMRSFIDGAVGGEAVNLLIQLAIAFIAVAILQQIINVLVVYLTEILGWSTTNDLRQEMARHLLGLDMSFHASHTPGEMIERVDGDIMALSNFFSQFILQVFANVLLVMGVLIVLFFVDWRIGLSLAIFVVLTMIVLLRLSNIAVPAWEAERQSASELYGFLEERLSGTEDIRSNNAMAYVLNQFYMLTRTLMRKTITAGLKLNILLNTTWILFAVGNAVAFVVSGWLYTTGQITIGTVYMVFHYSNMISWPLERITQQMQDLQKAGASLTRVLGIQRIQGAIPGENDFSIPASRVLPSGPLGVSFKQVTFGYADSQAASLALPKPANAATLEASSDPAQPLPEKEMVLKDISFHLPPGKVVGLLGRTGSGKTTLTRLLFRLYDPDQGVIAIGDGQAVDLRQVPIQELRQRIGMVTQNIQLFHATVRENLTFFDPTISDEKIDQAIEDLGLGDWFHSLPNGLETELTSGGGGLSAGEAQLLAFTRIFLRDPGLVILDEATSRLDPATEGLIEQAVDKLLLNRTAIIVAHRLGTVQRADDILILSDGKIEEYGARVELAADPGSRFFQLLKAGMEEVLV